MSPFFKKVRSIVSIILLLLVLWVLSNLTPSMALDPQSILRSDLRSLEVRIRSLEANVRRLQQSSSGSSAPSVNPNTNVFPQVIDGELIGRSDPLMERFATLLIELKEKVRDLEIRVNQLENKLQS